MKQGLARATKTLRGVRSAWVKEQHVRIGDDGVISEYQVNLKITLSSRGRNPTRAVTAIARRPLSGR